MLVSNGWYSETPASAATSFVYKSRTRNEPTQANLQQWTTTMWNRLELLVEDMGNTCIKVRIDLLLSLPRLQSSLTDGSIRGDP